MIKNIIEEINKIIGGETLFFNADDPENNVDGINFELTKNMADGNVYNILNIANNTLGYKSTILTDILTRIENEKIMLLDNKNNEIEATDYQKILFLINKITPFSIKINNDELQYLIGKNISDFTEDKSIKGIAKSITLNLGLDLKYEKAHDLISSGGQISKLRKMCRENQKGIKKTFNSNNKQVKKIEKTKKEVEKNPTSSEFQNQELF